MIRSSGSSNLGSASIGSSSAAHLALTMAQAHLDEDQPPDTENSPDQSLSLIASEHSREEALISILSAHPWSPENSAAFNLVNTYGQNLAHLCAQLRYHRLLTAVIEWGVDINIIDVNGWTPLDFAGFYGDLDAVDILEGGWEDDIESLEEGIFSPVQLTSMVPSSPPQTDQLAENPAEREPPSPPMPPQQPSNAQPPSV